MANVQDHRSKDLNPKESWIKPIFQYLQDGSILDDEKYLRTFGIKASRFNIIEDTLFKKFVVGPYLRCLENNEAKIIVKEINEGEYGNHTGGMEIF